MISYKSTKCKLKNVLAKRAFVRATLALLTFQKLVKLVGAKLARLAKDKLGLKVLKPKRPSSKLEGLQSINRTWDGNRTHTSVTAHRILSPACLPVPPPKRPCKTQKHRKVPSCFERKTGFEPATSTLARSRSTS